MIFKILKIIYLLNISDEQSDDEGVEDNKDVKFRKKSFINGGYFSGLF